MPNAKRLPGAPKHPPTAYNLFIQSAHQQLKRQPHAMRFGEITQQCAIWWNSLPDEKKKPFVDQAEQEKILYQQLLAQFVDGQPRAAPATVSPIRVSQVLNVKEPAEKIPRKATGEKGRKKKKDPNCPKRPSSAFILFCAAERPVIRQTLLFRRGLEEARELGRRWSVLDPGRRAIFDQQADADKARYKTTMLAYRGGGYQLPPMTVPANQDHSSSSNSSSTD